MNSNVKKLIIIFTPIFAILLALTIMFGVLGTVNANKYNHILDNKYVSYTEKELIVTPSESNGYDVDCTITLENKGTTALKNFMIEVTFEDETGEIYTYSFTDSMSFGSKKMDINVNTNFEKEVKKIKDVSVKIDNVFTTIYTDAEYKEVYGENPEFVSKITVEAFSVLTIACAIFSAITLVTGGCLIALFYKKKN